MEPNHGVDPLHDALVHQAHRSTLTLVVGRLLRGLEDEANRTGGEALRISFLCQNSGRADHSRHMTIVPTRVHDTRVLRDEVVRVRLLYRKGVHVRAERDEGTLTIVEFGDHAGSADPRSNGEAERLHLHCGDPRGSDFSERKLRMLVKVSTYRGEFCGVRLGLFEKIHEATLLVAGEKKPRLACPSESIAATRGEFRIPYSEGRIARMLDDRLTEQRNQRSSAMDVLSPLELVDLINSEDRSVAEAVGSQRIAVARAIELVVEVVPERWALDLCGCGHVRTPWRSRRGGNASDFWHRPWNGEGDHRRWKGGAGRVPGGRRGSSGGRCCTEIDGLAVGAKDFVMGIATSGTTPFVHGALARARELGARTGFLLCTSPAPELLETHDVVIAPLVGPEVVTGSTRMKAGTATKMVLNTITTGAMVMTGKVFGNLMVDLQTTCEKLQDRGERILMTILDVDRPRASELLEAAGGRVKIALVMDRREAGVEEAGRLLEEAGGVLAQVIGTPPEDPSA